MACILDTVDNPSAQDAENAINQWNEDVGKVNDFLNDFSTLGDATAIQDAAMNVLRFAQDEPCQLQTLLNNPDFIGGSTNGFNCARDDLQKVFQPHVLDNINDIIMSPGSNSTTQGAVDDINTFRCCNVLPDLDILWQDSATDNGIADVVPIMAGRENACMSIDCTMVSTAAQCKEESN
ncbi:uncharacterized protein K452DRAFT_288779 [Aplosporella prunicola CBS 121167]|uniref:Uncharacterized protein n=1 Tax=Aplosporella prunicola CBS 121167 TaxID=1176127 RepID=A0A6A6B9I5_9PEZI|nr:uncharacterized protein K452DRAFT_288779 [Aplosporella prunicola CBS 121167]KAF2140686.1 hypothetical protein K452DRAFT_288779 [Aplosporella prunicola CBS 121167]